MTDESADRWIVRNNGRFTDLCPSGEPNQYAIAADSCGLFLRTVTREEWVAEPRIIDIESRSLIARIQ